MDAGTTFLFRHMTIGIEHKANVLAVPVMLVMLVILAPSHTN